MLISKIPPKVSERDLVTFFKQFGPIERAYLGKQNRKQIWRSGFVVFKDRKSLQIVKSKEKIEIKGSVLIISQVGKKNSAENDSSSSVNQSHRDYYGIR